MPLSNSTFLYATGIGENANLCIFSVYFVVNKQIILFAHQ